MYKTFTYKQRVDMRKNYEFWHPNSCPYSYFEYNISDYFTPIEQNIWNELRANGLPFYFQYPVLNYFLDFADPIRKIGIEVDGEKFHQDKDKDSIRQKKIEKLGWKIIRIPGYLSYYKINKDDMDIWEDNEGGVSEYDEQEDYVSGLNSYRTEMISLINSYKDEYTTDKKSKGPYKINEIIDFIKLRNEIKEMFGKGFISKYEYWHLMEKL